MDHIYIYIYIKNQLGHSLIVKEFVAFKLTEFESKAVSSSESPEVKNLIRMIRHSIYVHILSAKCTQPV